MFEGWADDAFWRDYLPPAGTLVGLAKRGLKGVPATAVNTPEDLETVRGTLG